jgi:hypothetical protein
MRQLFHGRCAESSDGPSKLITRTLSLKPFYKKKFVKDGIICLVYVEHCLFFGRHHEDIMTLISDIEAAGFTLTLEEDVHAFLGVQVHFDPDQGTVTLLQPGLIKKIIGLTGLQDSNSKATPAEKDPLGPGTELAPPHKEYWEYPTLIGCLLYLANNTRPDIQYAVHSCARYTHRPRELLLIALPLRVSSTLYNNLMNGLLASRGLCCLVFGDKQAYLNSPFLASYTLPKCIQWA